MKDFKAIFPLLTNTRKHKRFNSVMVNGKFISRYMLWYRLEEVSLDKRYRIQKGQSRIYIPETHATLHIT